MTAIRQIRAPHPALDATKVAALAALYEAQADVTPVVALEWAEGPVAAISGSHRLAAMTAAGLGGEDIDDMGAWVVVLDAEEIYSAASEMVGSDDDDGRAAEIVTTLESIANGNGAGDYSRLCEALVALRLVEGDAAAALEGQ